VVRFKKIFSMKKLNCWICVLVMLLAASTVGNLCAQESGDTLWVQTYTFEEQNDPETAYESPGRRWFDMPADDGTEFQKILMYYKLKCFEDGTAGNLGYACGEWDYLSYSFLWDHTGLFDSTLIDHPLYLYNNTDFDTVMVGTQEYTHMQIIPTELSNILNINSESTAIVGEDDLEVNYPFETSNSRSRTHVLWTAQELIDSGLSPGSITGMRLEISEPNMSINWMGIRSLTTEQDSITSFLEGDWNEHYGWSVPAEDVGWYHFQFNEAIAWNGIDNLVIEFAQKSSNIEDDFGHLATNVASETVVHTSQTDGYVHFDWNDQVNVPQEAFSDMDEQVTVSFWLYGDPAVQPQNGTTFEGVGANNERVLNSHTPWSNSNVYWDAGWDGGYDRINAEANAEDFSGKWSHWAFTKNTTTGIMVIYLNGEEWLSGDNRDNPLSGIVEFSIGSASSWQNYYNGFMDEFQIWNTALDEESIASWMYRDVDDSHPMWEDLLVYYKFNGENGDPFLDHSSNGLNGVGQGSPNRIRYQANELFRNFNVYEVRPNATFVQGDYEIESQYDQSWVSVPVPPVSISEWQVTNDDFELVDIEYYYPEGYSYLYDQNGEAIDSVFWGGETQFINGELFYYEEPFEILSRYELGRFITPYGINLDLEDGWTWIYDVTDFAPFLRDSVDMAAGNWQELLDMKFAYIYGTPPRDVKRVERLWNGNWGLAGFDANVDTKTFEFEDGEEMARVKATTTGHGFGSGNNCAEFCNNVHSLEVNGQTEWSWQIMQECADNPLYPQGGTWVYDRAGWCPGMEGELYEFEITPWVEEGEVDLDYDIEYDPDGNYVFESYVVTYGAPNAYNDVEISEILAPSDFRLHSRENPLCKNPMIRIRNNGQDTLTSCLVTYSVEGGQEQTYTWTGKLAFIETEDIELSYADPIIYEGDEDEILTFHAAVSLPNGVGDENHSNNATSSRFKRPPVLTYLLDEDDDDDNRLVFWLNTNNSFWETTYTLYNSSGGTVFENDEFFESNASYKDTVFLNQGCYTFHLQDSGDDGLQFFANNDGAGTMRFKKVLGPVIKSFEQDFGKEIKYSFFWKTDLVGVEDIEPIVTPELSIYPNPSEGLFYLQLENFDHDVHVDVFDASGRKLISEDFNNPGRFLKILDLSDKESGLYIIRVSDDVHTISTSVIKN